MPSLQDLNTFKNAVNQLGNEPEVVQSRDEILEDIQPGEESAPLMPELLGSEEENRVDTQEQPSLQEQSSSPRIVMDNEADEQNDFAENGSLGPFGMDGDAGGEFTEEPSYALPSEFDSLLNNLQDDEFPTEPSIADPDISDTPPDDLDVLDDISQQFLNPENEKPLQPEERNEELVVPQAVYQMLNTGFSELDSERLNLDILGEIEASAPISEAAEGSSAAVAEPSFASELDTHKQPPSNNLATSQNDQDERLAGLAELLEEDEPAEPPTGTDSLGDSENSQLAGLDSSAAASSGELESFDAANGELQQNQNDISAQDVRGTLLDLAENEPFQESNFVAQDTSTQESEEDDQLQSIPLGSSPTLETIDQLERALRQHRSIDLLNIGEKDSDESENGYEELEFSISHENARNFLLQLSSYPIALKLAIEEEIGENELREEAVETLVEMVSSGVNPRHVANYFFSQTGKRILLPKGQRYHAADHRDQDLRFANQFYQIGFPLLHRTIIVVIFIAIFFWLPFYYVYRPIQAYLFYKQGLSKIFHDRFNEAEYYFTLATNGWPLLNDRVFVKGWPFKSWYLKYALGYAARKDFTESTFKLRETLRQYPAYRDAWFQYIALLSQQMGEYAQAEEIIQQYYNRFGRDYQSLIIRGQNYLYWGDVDPAYYEDARQTFATVYSLGSNDDRPLLYLLDCYIRTAPYSSNDAKLQTLTSFFLENNPLNLKVPPHIFARIISKTADYYLQKGDIDIAKKLLLNANKVVSDSMEIYRSFANYYHLIHDKSKELEALNMSLFFLKLRDDRNTTPNLLEKMFLTRQRAQFFIENDGTFNTGVILSDLMVELKKVERRRLTIDHSNNAKIYAMYGDFYYKKIPQTLSSIPYYQEATSHGVHDPYVNYRYGYQLYQQKNFKQAVKQFLQGQLELPDNNKIQYALGNSLLQIGNYNSAQGVLEGAYSAIQEDLRSSYLLNPQQALEARDQLFMLVRLANDLGVSYYRESLQSPNTTNEETAMAYLIQGMGYLDLLSREDTVELKLPPELLFQPRLLTRKTITLLEDSIPAQGLAPGSLPDRNLKEILRNRVATLTPNTEIRPYWLDILDPEGLQETMDY